MKTIIILLACIACLVGCDDGVVPSGDNRIKINGHTISIFDIDSCEYIGRIYGSSSDFLTHKGNCNYCRERNKPFGVNAWGTHGETSDQSLSAPAGSVKLGGTLMPNTTINKKAWTDASKATRDTMVIHYY